LQGKDAVGAISLMFSGWVNPLVLLYWVLHSLKLGAGAARLAARFALLLATWVFLFKAR